eukprot:jgi/Bigna1/85638/estExt_fgenesh1_pg.C_50106
MVVVNQRIQHTSSAEDAALLLSITLGDGFENNDDSLKHEKHDEERRMRKQKPRKDILLHAASSLDVTKKLTCSSVDVSGTSGDDDSATDAASTLANLEFSPPLKRLRAMENNVSLASLKTDTHSEKSLDSLSITNSPNLGSSCHQCKSRRSQEELNWCRNMLAMQQGKKRPICRKKYCDRCLFKFLGEQPPRTKGKKQRDNWLCPACRGICTCAACRRKKNRLGGSTPTMSPLSLGNSPNLGSRKQRRWSSCSTKFTPKSTPRSSPDYKTTPRLLSSRSPSIKRKRSESVLSESFLARTAALALKTPQSAPNNSSLQHKIMMIPSLTLGSPAPLPKTCARSEGGGAMNHRIAHISLTPFKSSITKTTTTPHFPARSTIESIQEKLRRLSELSKIDDLKAT